MNYRSKTSEANRRAKKLGQNNRITSQQVRDRFEVHDCKCVYCGSGENITIDHRIPFHEGGKNIPSNIVPACMSCNASKSTLTPWQFKMGFRKCTHPKMHDRPKPLDEILPYRINRKELIASLEMLSLPNFFDN